MTPLPCVIRSIAWSTLGFVSSRLGPTVPVAPAAASVWQVAQPAEAKIAFPSGFPPLLGGGCCRSLDRLGIPGDVRHIVRHGFGILSGDELRRHPAALGGVVDLVEHDCCDRALLEPLFPGPRERLVEVGPDLPLGPGVRELVTGAALALGAREDLLAAARVPLGGEALRPTACSQGGQRD